MTAPKDNKRRRRVTVKPPAVPPPNAARRLRLRSLLDRDAAARAAGRPPLLTDADRRRIQAEIAAL